MTIDVARILQRVRSREVNRDFLPAHLLDVRDRTRTNALPWRGQFTPGLAELMLDTYDTHTGLIFDPFVGSGTTLIEAIRRGRTSVGVEVNPAAVTLARIFELASLSVQQRAALLQQVRRLINMEFATFTDGFFADAHVDDRPAHQKILDLISTTSPSVATLFHPAVLLSMGDAKETDSYRILKAWDNIERLVSQMPRGIVNCDVLLGDARATPLADDVVGTVLTSPPYINVFNYHQNYRPAIELLGWEVLPAARGEIGSNRKHRGNRFLTVIQYVQDMTLAVSEMLRVCRDGANVVLVVGRESRVRGVAFANGEILSVIAESLPGLSFVRWQERQFTNRFGLRIFEEVLTFNVSKSPPHAGPVANPEKFGRELGTILLEEALAEADAEDVAKDLRSAISGASTVMPSPQVHLSKRGYKPINEVSGRNYILEYQGAAGD
ncbi:MAG: hypothetical protein JO281_06525 [Pseudonocardiales bacterium]|nr:hypothetical protein [Pseudonocardiales bacterium]